MAKKTHAYQLKGIYYHAKRVVAEYDKKTETTTYYSIDDILKEFDGRELTFGVKEENAVQPAELTDDDLESDDEE